VGTLQLRPLAPGDETAVRRAADQLAADDFAFALGYQEGMSWRAYLRSLERRRLGYRRYLGRIPSTLLVAESDGRIVGRTSIRHTLDQHLLHEGGHIGFGVLPAERRKGFATEMLRLSLPIARGLGIRRVLVCCREDNQASRTVITRCGGRLTSTVESSSGFRVQRYWIPWSPSDPKHRS
jgi:predicted acetyltransferase